jgi:metal-responsive CopG/Arc/MetJ family transcriptional regulator
MNTSIRDNMRTPKKRAPATGELVGVRVQPDMAKKLDDWRRRQQDIPGRPEAIRRLVEQALETSKKK